MKYAFSIIKYLKNRCTAESSARAILNGSANRTTPFKKLLWIDVPFFECWKIIFLFCYLNVQGTRNFL